MDGSGFGRDGAPNAGGFPPLGAFIGLVFHRLAIGKGAKTLAFDDRVVNKHILAILFR
jgi:hypothetical protein